MTDDGAPTLRHSVSTRVTLVNMIVLYSAPLLIVWAAILYLGYSDGLGFLGNTRWNLQTVHDAPSAVAGRSIQAHFSQKLMQYTFSHGVLTSPSTLPPSLSA